MKKDFDLGNGVFIRWTNYEGERVGGLLIHPLPDGAECFGTFWFEGNIYSEKNPNENRPTWKFNGDFKKPGLEPSFLCHCGFHGFIRKGKWVQA